MYINDLRDNRKFSVQLYSRRARLISEFSLDAKQHNLPDMEAAAEHLRQTLPPCEFATTVSLAHGDGGDDETILQFDLKRILS